MLKRTVFHIVPASLPTFARVWAVKLEGRDEMIRVSQVKGTLVSWAKSQCQDLARHGVPAQVILHTRDGEFETEYTYLKDPKETRG